MKWMIPALACLSVFILHPCVFADVDHSAFDAILKANVREERVDYLNIRKNQMAALNGYLRTLASTDPASLARDEQLAFYINLYNATMIREVINRYHPGYSPSEKDFAVFKEPVVALKSGKISLNDLENKIIRPTFKDPRIHTALVCAARSCPPILNRAYRADDLDATLEANMKRFVNDPGRNLADPRRKELRLSQIFEWYADDFGGKAAVAAYVDKYHPASTSGWKVSSIPYSWELNIAK